MLQTLSAETKLRENIQKIMSYDFMMLCGIFYLRDTLQVHERLKKNGKDLNIKCIVHEPKKSILDSDNTDYSFPHLFHKYYQKV